MLRTGIILGAVFLFLAGCATEKPVERAPLPQETAEIYFNRGVDSSQKGDFKKAISDFNKAIDVIRNLLSPTSTEETPIAEWVSLIRQLQITPRLSNSIQDMPIAYYNRGFVYRRMGEYDEPFLDFTKAIEIDPKYCLGILLSRPYLSL